MQLHIRYFFIVALYGKIFCGKNPNEKSTKTLDTQNAANGGEMGTGSDTGAFFIGELCEPG
ncbi:hypothetical protein EBAG_00528 [Escherichia coli T426]|nr:hypothetical protein EBAG_00528 [Escherichia coli T426]